MNCERLTAATVLPRPWGSCMSDALSALLQPDGLVAEWLRRGLQILVRGFDSLRGLQLKLNGLEKKLVVDGRFYVALYYNSFPFIPFISNDFQMRPATPCDMIATWRARSRYAPTPQLAPNDRRFSAEGRRAAVGHIGAAP